MYNIGYIGWIAAFTSPRNHPPRSVRARSRQNQQLCVSKPQNILLKTEDECQGRISARAVVSDFGTAAVSPLPFTAKIINCQGVLEPRVGTGFTGTMEYTAPELLVQDSSVRTPKTDCFVRGSVAKIIRLKAICGVSDSLCINWHMAITL